MFWDTAKAFSPTSNLPVRTKNQKLHFLGRVPGLFSLCLGNGGSFGDIVAKSAAERGGQSPPLVAQGFAAFCNKTSELFTSSLYGRSALFCNGAEAQGTLCDVNVNNPRGSSSFRNPHQPWYCDGRCGRYTGISHGSQDEFFCETADTDETFACGKYVEGVCDQRCRNVCYEPPAPFLTSIRAGAGARAGAGGVEGAEDEEGGGAGGGVRQCMNVGSIVSQSEALGHAQTAFWNGIILCQVASLIACKTRWLSVRDQGVDNSLMQFGILFELTLIAWFCYCEPLQGLLGTRGLRLVHLFPALPFVILIFAYDEGRKALMRLTSPTTADVHTGQIIKHAGWLERFTYY